MSMGKKSPEHIGRMILIGVIAFVIVAACILLMYVYQKYTIKTFYVEGNVHYTDEEIIEKVTRGRLGNNSLYLNFKYQKKQIEDIPFVSAIEVDIVSPDTVKITVYEKSLAGYVVYLGRCMYFDKDGTVVESSEEKTEGIPEVVGLQFDHVVKYEKLPIDNDEVFEEVLNLSQSLDKYELSADKIYFDDSFKVTLFFGKVRVNIGDDEYIDEKFSLLQSILPSLEGKSGILEMSNYSEDVTSYTFTSDVDL